MAGKLSRRLAALERRAPASGSIPGVLIYPAGLSDTGLETWIGERRACLPPGQPLILLPENNRQAS